MTVHFIEKKEFFNFPGSPEVLGEILEKLKIFIFNFSRPGSAYQKIWFQ